MKKTIRLQFTVFPEYAEKIKRANTDPFDSESTYIMKLIDRELASLSMKTPEETTTKPQQTIERDAIKPQQIQEIPEKAVTRTPKDMTPEGWQHLLDTIDDD